MTSRLIMEAESRLGGSRVPLDLTRHTTICHNYTTTSRTSLVCRPAAQARSWQTGVPFEGCPPRDLDNGLAAQVATLFITT
jgi:hypothetical protein